MNALDLFYMALAGATSPFWMRKARGGWAERLGKVEPLGEARVGGRKRLLIHAVSVGEVSALRELVPRLVEEVEVVISVTTDTGIAHARKVFGETCHVVRYPLDFSWSVQRFLDAIKPDVVGLVELEIWPNFVRACDRRGVPVCVINGRLSERSFRGYRKIRPWIGPSFRRLAFAAVQDEAYAQRFRAMGVAAEACTVTGSMKWDASRIEDEVAGSEDLAREMGIDRSRPLIVAGSTGPGEEAMLHEACPAGVQLLCAPRKPERFDEAASALPGCRRRSRTMDAKSGGGGASGASWGAEGAVGAGADRFLLDTLGELRRAYALADVVVVGRSFRDLYGSDPIGPVSLGKAVLIGPQHSDFGVMVEALREAGGIEVCGRDKLGGVLGALLADSGRRAGLGACGRACIAAHQGASGRHGKMLIGACGGGGGVVS